MSKKLWSWALLASLFLLASSCGGAPAATAATPSVESLGEQGTCKVAKDPLNPLIVEWPGTSKVELATSSQRGVVVVSYVGCVLKILSGCQAGGGYAMTSVTPVKDRITVADENELYARLPLGVASLKGELKTAGRLDLEYVAVGQRIALQAPSDVAGPECLGATHYVKAITVGAYSLDAVGHASGTAGASMGDTGVSAARREDVRRLRGSGNVGACEQASAAGCDAILQLGLAPLARSEQTERKVAAHAGAKKEAAQASADAGPMVRIPAGMFWMGSPDGVAESDEHPRHQVRVAGFEMDVTEVTVAAYAACTRTGQCAPMEKGTIHWVGVKETDRETLGRFCNYGHSENSNHPMNCVDWDQANHYCRAVGKRLPTEEEWEYAARGTDERSYPWGNDAPGSQLCWSGLDPSGIPRPGTCAVGSLPQGRSPFGLLDMGGNVAEWTSSGYSQGYGQTRDEATRVVRGGAYSDGKPPEVRATHREHRKPYNRLTALGFRCAR